MMSIIISRLVYLQVYKHDEFVAETEKLLQRAPRWLETARGTIYDRNGEVLANDVPEWRIKIHYKLARLFDRRYYLYFAHCYRHQEGKENAPDSEVLKYFTEKFGYQRYLAGEMIDELAQLCNVSVEELREEINRVNDEIFSTRLWLARRKFYSSRNLERPVTHSKEEYFADFEKCVPDEYTRLRLIYYYTTIQEMEVPQVILKPVSREIALAVESHFNGEFLSETDSSRLITIGADKDRIYPFGDAAPQVIGQIGPTQAQFKRISWGDMPLPNELAGYQAGDRRGLWGIEYMFEDYLRGTRGWQQKDIDGDIIHKIDQSVGSDVILSLDIKLQADIQKLFAGNSSVGLEITGGGVVIDVESGEVLAMVSSPGFDLNRFYEQEVYSSIWPDVTPAPLRTPLTNLALSWNYQSGSTLKPTNLLGGLEMGVIDSDTIFYVDGSKDWTGGPSDIHITGDIDVFQAIRRSSNFFPIKVFELLGPETAVDWLNKAGFGRRILAWPDDFTTSRSWFSFRETAGYVSTIGRKYPRMTDLRYAAIGRGPISCSVLQIANSMATIARGGVFLSPTLIKSPVVDRAHIRIASEANADIIRKGMFDVINNPGGTAYDAFFPTPWDSDVVALYGKTGSTDYSVFASFAESFDNRKVAVAVLAEVHKNGSEVAAPLVRDILELCGRHGYLPNLY